jgi:hypothetical protein
MKWLHLRRQEGEWLNYGLTFYPLSDKHSIGFMFRTEERYFRLRYSKKVKKWFWQYVRLEPKAWRILKGEE